MQKCAVAEVSLEREVSGTSQSRSNSAAKTIGVKHVSSDSVQTVEPSRGRRLPLHTTPPMNTDRRIRSALCGQHQSLACAQITQFWGGVPGDQSASRATLPGI